MADNYYVAKSYEKYERVGEPFTSKGRLYTKVRCKCDRCVNGIYAVGVHNGEIVPHPAYNGVCLKCNGTGFIEKTVRLYTEKEHEQNIKNAERRDKIREETRLKEALGRDAAKQSEWLERNGFNSNGFTYCIAGDNTYAIKDYLKEQGYKFSSLLMWHGPNEIEIPEGYFSFELNWKDYYIWTDGTMIFKEGAEEQIKNKFNEYKELSLSEYIGEIGTKINITVTFVKAHSFQSKFGMSNVLTFKSDNNILTWFTSTEPDIELGATYSLTATVKDHKEYNSEKTTIITRCKLKPID